MKDNSYIIADHVRACCFIIADGVRPSGKQRGYVLRRLMRRSFSASLKMGIDISKKAYFEALIDSVLGIYEGVYTELAATRDIIIETFIVEAQKYLKSIETGKKEWAKILA
jgi:alanyl-tRNA synthetase